MAAQSLGNTAPNAPAPIQPAARHHCKKMAEVIAKYLTEDELAEFVQTQMRFAWAIALKRYSPGLLDASYEQFAASNLRRA